MEDTKLGSQRFKYHSPGVKHNKCQGWDENSHVSYSKAHAPSTTRTTQVLRVISGKSIYHRDTIKLTRSGHGCRTTQDGTDAVVGNALVITRKWGVKRKDSQRALMNLNLFHVSVQPFSIMQPWDMSSHRFSRAMQYYRSTKFLDSRQWLRNKIRCQVCKGTFPVHKGWRWGRDWGRRGDMGREKKSTVNILIGIYTTKGNPLLHLYAMVLKSLCKF